MFVRISYLVLFLSMPFAIYLNYLYAPTEKLWVMFKEFFISIWDMYWFLL